MAPFDFKTRFIAALPQTPPRLALYLSEFIKFDKSVLTGLSQEDCDFLASQGLPRNASPFLSFAAYSPEEVAQHIETYALPANCFPIGHNGSGDIVAIEKNLRQVVYFNHDAHNLRVFINSTLPQFAECLCVFQEHLRSKTMHLCLAAIERIDSAAAKSNNMWHSEIMAEVTSG